MSHAGTSGKHSIDTDVAKQVVEEIERELQRRIRPLIAHWPEAEIALVLRKMAEVKYRYEGAASLRRKLGQVDELTAADNDDID